MQPEARLFIAFGYDLRTWTNRLESWRTTGKQIQVEDSDGNPIELFEPAR
jgi:hypothetical protein